MSFLSKIFSKGAKDIIDSSGNIIDKISTSDQEKMNAKNELSSIVFDSLNTLQNAQKEIILSETKGNWLQRSWRPLVMLTFTALIVLGAFIEIPYLENNSRFWTLLEIGLGGYVIGRSVEKVSENVTKNSDISFLRKKDRKDIYG
jgi:hypothetical protein